MPNEPIIPLTPSEVHVQFTRDFDPYIIQAVNNLLVKKFSPGIRSLIIKRDEVLTEYFRISPSDGRNQAIRRAELFENHQLDFEELFSKYGWIVKYDKPGWDETYEPFFEFVIKK